MSVQILKLLLVLMCKYNAYVNCWPFPKYYDSLSSSLSLLLPPLSLPLPPFSLPLPPLSIKIHTSTDTLFKLFRFNVTSAQIRKLLAIAPSRISDCDAQELMSCSYFVGP